MWLADYLSRPVTPLSDWETPDARKRERKTNKQRNEEALATYRAAMKRQWMSPAVASELLGKNKSTVRAALGKWEKQGITESRRIGKVRKIYEWRFK